MIEGKPEGVEKLVQEINQGAYEMINFNVNEKYEVWSVFKRFLLSFEKPTIPESIDKILMESCKLFFLNLIMCCC